MDRGMNGNIAMQSTVIPARPCDGPSLKVRVFTHAGLFILG